MQKIDSLTGLRAFAAIWVVLFHYRYGIRADDYGALAFIFRRGYLGVPVFFTLSGFILAHVHRRDFATGIRAADALRFLWLRLARVYPVHLAMLLGMALVLMPLHIMQREAADTPYSFALNLFLLQAWGFVDGVSWNEVSWSISSEWFAYLLFPALALATRRLKGAKAIGLLVAALALYVGTRFLASAVLPDHDLIGFRYGISVVNYALLFGFGFALYIFAEALPKASRLYDLGAIGSVLAIIGLALVEPYYEWFLIPIVTGALVVSLYRARGASECLFGNPVAVYLGEISYSLYMSHIATFWLLYCGFFQNHLPWFQLSLPLELCVALIGGAALYHLVEVPGRRWMRAAMGISWLVSERYPRNS
jgi:peptidoglycan/LPS O-acetylase OafA/YrhL